MTSFQKTTQSVRLCFAKMVFCAKVLRLRRSFGVQFDYFCFVVEHKVFDVFVVNVRFNRSVYTVLAEVFNDSVLFQYFCCHFSLLYLLFEVQLIALSSAYCCLRSSLLLLI